MHLPPLVLDVLFPDACLACLAPKESAWRHEIACDRCLDTVTAPRTFACAACGAPIDRLVPPCHPQAASAVVAGTTASRVLGALTAGLLYEGITRAAPALAELVADAAVSCGLPLHRATVVPLPESAYAARARGYAAHELVARPFAEALRLPLSPGLLTASALGGGTVYGLGRAGDAAASEHVVAVGVTLPFRTARERMTELLRAACPHATVTFATATP